MQAAPVDVLRWTIRALRYAMVIGAATGVCLLACAFLLIPVIGFAAADVGAIGSWCLLFAVLMALLFAAAAVAARLGTGSWYLGEQDPVMHFVAAHRTAVAAMVAIVLMGIVLVMGWLNMH